jgi:tRNA1Val (adenine37-N6)-methyltransferase
VANTFFQFKNFIVHQEHTSMKVCTDACLFGAWTSNDSSVSEALNVLDIGAGTGLLSLIVAQANENAKITAIEIEQAAAKEAVTNFKLSPWNDRLYMVHDAVQNFSKQTNTTFDVIITNPPFYEADLKSPNENKNIAAHSTALPWDDLVEHVAKLLNNSGSFFVLTPTLRAYTMQKICEANGLELIEEVLVHNTIKNLPIRAMQKFTKFQQVDHQTQKSNTRLPVKRTKICIKDNDNNYTPEFIALLKNYYLHL